MNEFLYLLWKQRQMCFQWFNKVDKVDEKLYLLGEINRIEEVYNEFKNDYNEIKSVI